MTECGNHRSPTIVDLFSGCGGFSLGAHHAGFRSVVAVDIDGTLQSSYRRNFPETLAVQASVTDLDGSAWSQLIGRQRPDGVIGGPPCQGFSSIGKRRSDDPRNSLVSEFFRNVSVLRPKFFVMENVAGILRGENMELIRNAATQLPNEYVVLDPIVLNAAEMGAATTRRRVVVIGYDPCDMDQITASDLLPKPNATVTVRDAISDLGPPVPESQIKDFGWGTYAGLPHSAYARRLRRAPPRGVGSEDVRDFTARGLVSGMYATRHLPRMIERYSGLVGGKSDPITKSYKLSWDGLCPTLRAGTGSERGAFQAVRPIHPGEGRVISVREAARFQGFPDWFTFHEAKWHSFRMIGNSVSPIVSERIFEAILPKLSVRLAA